MDRVSKTIYFHRNHIMNYIQWMFAQIPNLLFAYRLAMLSMFALFADDFIDAMNKELVKNYRLHDRISHSFPFIQILSIVWRKIALWRENIWLTAHEI